MMVHALYLAAVIVGGEWSYQNAPVWADTTSQVTLGTTTTDADEADRQAIAQLAQNSDVTKPTDVIFYLIFSTQSQATVLKDEISKMGFNVEIHELKDYSVWALAANKTLVPSESNIISLGHTFTALASSQQGKYDGWEAAHVK